MTSSFYWLMSFVKQKVVIGIYLELNRISKRSIPIVSDESSLKDTKPWLSLSLKVKFESDSSGIS